MHHWIPRRNSTRCARQTEAGRSSVKAGVFRVLTVLLALAGSFAFAEVFCRVLYTPPYRFSLCGGSYCFDERWGLHSCPDYVGCATTKAILSNKEDAEYVETLNSFGCRGGEPVLPKPADTFRVLFLGDSYVKAGSVLLDETLASQFARQSGIVPPEGFREIDTYDAGFSGFCTYQQTEWFLNSGKRIDPDLVFLVFTHNDVTAYKQHMSSRVSTNHYYLPKGVVDMRKYAGIYLMEPFDAHMFLTMNGYAYQFYQFWIKPFAGLDPPVEQLDSKTLAVYDTYSVYEEKIERVREDFNRLNADMLKDGRRLVIVMLPAELEVRDNEVDGAFFRHVRRIGVEFGISVIDALPPLRRARQAGTKVYGSVYDGDTHCHANGLEIVAGLAADWVTANRNALSLRP